MSKFDKTTIRVGDLTQLSKIYVSSRDKISQNMEDINEVITCLIYWMYRENSVPSNQTNPREPLQKLTLDKAKRNSSKLPKNHSNIHQIFLP